MQGRFVALDKSPPMVQRQISDSAVSMKSSLVTLWRSEVFHHQSNNIVAWLRLRSGIDRAQQRIEVLTQFACLAIASFSRKVSLTSGPSRLKSTWRLSDRVRACRVSQREAEEGKTLVEVILALTKYDPETTTLHQSAGGFKLGHMVHSVSCSEIKFE